MAYVTINDYLNFGIAPPDDFDFLAEMASSQIDMVTGYKLCGNLDGLTEYAQQQVKNAVCVQIQWIDNHGGVSYLASEPLASATLGRYSYSSSTSGQSGRVDGQISPLVAGYLMPTGLLYVGVRLL